MKKQYHLFLTALMFYTRIPVPAFVDHDAGRLNKATKYFPLIGWIVGGMGYLTWMLTALLLPQDIAILMSMVATIWITGAFHEDGFADSCDGFGGGWTRSRILDIMKDSRMGAFGVIGLVLILLLKYRLLVSLPVAAIGPAMILGHSLSRWAASTFILTHEYVRENEDAKAKPVAKAMDTGSFLTATLFGWAPLLMLRPSLLWLVPVPVYLVKFLLGRFFQKWIGGYTGDCLGATQQICEIIIYLSFIILWKFT